MKDESCVSKDISKINDKCYIAKISKDDREESVGEHSYKAANIAEDNAMEMLKGTARLIALLHDAGKNCEEFYNYIKKKDNRVDDMHSTNAKQVTHSTAGGIIVTDLASKKPDTFAAEVIRHCIISHHGLNDCVSPEGEVKFAKRKEKQQGMDSIYQEVCKYISEEYLRSLFDTSVKELAAICHKITTLTSASTKEKQYGAKSFYHGMLARLLLSLLIDADWTASACFEKGNETKPSYIPTMDFWDALIGKLEMHLATKFKDAENRQMAQLRQEISVACREAGMKSGNIVRLVVPTGAGKTYSSLQYALHQAKEFSKKRIFYIAPYNSILEQNGNEYREALGNPGIEVILEHHSNLIPDDTEKYKELTQNWNAPIVLTSAVQFLNTLFDSKSGAIRRMYALTDAVIIVDEVQAIPTRCIALFNLAMNFLSYICGTTIVLCSATQPPFERLPANSMIAPTDMIPDAVRYQSAFKRTHIIDSTAITPGGMGAGSAAQFVSRLLNTNTRILTIVNTKRCAKDIFEELKERFSGSTTSPKLYHLSANMCSKHRLDIIKKIKEMDEKIPLICISTQLVEAGVDFSFSAVIRSVAGMQNIIQSAGRCNRNAEVECGDVHIVKMADDFEDLSSLQEIRDMQGAFFSMLSSLNGSELDSMEAIENYYKFYLYGKEQTICYPGPEKGDTLVDLLTYNAKGTNNLKRAGVERPIFAQAFKTAGDHFQVIEEKGMIDILVEYDERSSGLIADLNSKLDSKKLESLLPQLQPYTVSISPTTFSRLGNAVYKTEFGDIHILQKNYYSCETGVSELPAQMEFLETHRYK